MKKIEKITGGTVYPNQTNDLIDNTEELNKRVLANKESIENLDSKIIKNSNDISSNYTTLNNKINNLQTGGSGGTGGSSDSSNSYKDFEITDSKYYKDLFPNISTSGILRIQGGMFQFHIESDMNNEPVFANQGGFSVKIVDRDNYITSMLLDANTIYPEMAITSGSIEFYYKTEGKPQAVKSCNAHILTGFYDIKELGVYIFGNGLNEFNEGSDMKSFKGCTR